MVKFKYKSVMRLIVVMISLLCALMSYGQNGTYNNRTTSYYSIDYPKEWVVIENPDNMSDVYIGEERLGCMILMFEASESLEQINRISNASLEEGGFEIKSSQLVYINGQSCYKSIFEFNLRGVHYKQVSYTFKKGIMCYNVKFGNDKDLITSKRHVIDRMINSFRMK